MSNTIPHADLCRNCKQHKSSFFAVDLSGADYFEVTCGWYPGARMFFKHSPKCVYFERQHEAVGGYK